jgi:arylsulfatase
MEIYAGFLEHTDVQYGKVVDKLERQGILDSTLVIYIFSVNGPSAEGMNGSISELLAQNMMPSTIDQHIDVLNRDYGTLVNRYDGYCQLGSRKGCVGAV